MLTAQFNLITKVTNARIFLFCLLRQYGLVHREKIYLLLLSFTCDATVSSKEVPYAVTSFVECRNMGAESVFRSQKSQTSSRNFCPL